MKYTRYGVHMFNMHFFTTKGGRLGSEELHLMPMTIAEMNKVLAYWRRESFEISNLKIWRV